MVGASIVSQPYRGEADLLRLREFVMENYRRNNYWHVGDVVWRIFLISIDFDPGENIRLFEHAGRVVAFAIYDPREPSIGWQLALRDTACEEELLEWAAARFVRLGQPRGRLLAGAWETDTYKRALLERHGFHSTGQGYRLNVLDLRDWRAPDGLANYPVRCLTGEEEHAIRAQAHREVFRPSRVTDESYLHLMRMPGYERGLDLLAEAPGGQIGAFCLIWEDALNNVGEFEPVGTRPAFRRQGMARAVLVEGLRRLQVRGCTSAVVWVDADNTPAIALYESVGFRCMQRDISYEYRDHPS